MATSLKHETFHKNLECPICLSFFKEPKILTCSHTFCKGCLESLLESHQKLLCPTCREETSVPGGVVGRLQSNITVRSLVEDVETQGQVCTNSNRENKSLERKWNKCQKHPNYDEECFCVNCNKFVCCKCGLLEHAKDAHTILEADAHETEQKNHVKKLVSKADVKIRNVDKYFTFVEYQRKRVHNIQERLNGEIDATFEESVEKLKERKTVLKKEVGYKLGKIKTLLGDVEKSNRKQIDEIQKVLDLVKDGLNFPLQTEALTAHKAMCQQLEVLLNQIRPDEELPRRTAEEGERIGFRSQGSDELRLGQLTNTREVPAHTKSKWVLRTEAPLPAGKSMRGMVEVINDVSGAIIHSISKGGDESYPAVCQDESVIIAWVKRGQGLLSIVQYTKELKYIKNILTDFKINVAYTNRYSFLQAFKTGEIAFFYGDHRLYIFHETWE
ncbi:tripartite motif-containing protein 2-like [Strongylocentrotus purpuratus]|uniref:Uncharacterized protein n=1 Tax=Strongylocentrotus purpuratus TaxID=7668 RepID=A0A7M7PEP7_STRPU|nr:tripartite motif-containing protein 2-like [Strongylocentrotus purpuratus]